MGSATLTLQSGEFTLIISGPISRGCRRTRDDPGEPPSAEVETARIGGKDLKAEQIELLDMICDEWMELAKAALLEQSPTAADKADDTLEAQRGEALK